MTAARRLTPIPDSALTPAQQAALSHTCEPNPDRPGCCAMCGATIQTAAAR